MAASEGAGAITDLQINEWAAYACGSPHIRKYIRPEANVLMTEEDILQVAREALLRATARAYGWRLHDDEAGRTGYVVGEETKEVWREWQDTPHHQPSDLADTGVRRRIVGRAVRRYAEHAEQTAAKKAGRRMRQEGEPRLPAAPATLWPPRPASKPYPTPDPVRTRWIAPQPRRTEPPPRPPIRTWWTGETS